MGGRFKNALKCFDLILEIDEDNEDALLGKADSLRELKHYEEAVAYYERYFTKNKKNCPAWDDCGICYLEMGRQSDAERCFNQALALDPEYVYAYQNLGELWERAGDIPRALKYTKKSLALEMEQGNYYSLARYYALLGQKEPALKTLDDVISRFGEKYRNKAKKDSAFQSIRNSREFKQLISGQRVGSDFLFIPQYIGEAVFQDSPETLEGKAFYERVIHEQSKYPRFIKDDVLKIAVVESLVRSGTIGAFDWKQYFQDVPEDRDSTGAHKTIRELIVSRPLNEKLLASVKKVLWNDESDFQALIWKDWDGEENYFDIFSLEGIQYLPQLTVLEMWGNRKTDLSHLQQVKKLKEFTFHTDNLYSRHLEPLLELPALKRADIRGLRIYERPQIKAIVKSLLSRGVEVDLSFPVDL